VWPFRRRPGEQPVERRSIDSVPWDVGGVSQAAVSQDRALSLAPVYSATSLIAQDISTLPVDAFRRVGPDAREPMPSLPQLFDRMVSDGTIVRWLHELLASGLLRGNAVGLITARDGFGFPTAVTWLDMTNVTVIDTAPSGPGSYSMPLWYWMGRPVDRTDIVHIPWFTVPGKVLGLSPIGAFAATVNAGLHVTDYGNTWFEGGGFPPGTFSNADVEIDQEQATAIGARLDVARRRRRPLVYGKGWTYAAISVPPNEAQFVEAAQLNANQIAAIYHVPADWIGGQSGGGLHYSTAEQDQTQYVLHAVRPWVETLEKAFFALLPERQYVRLNMRALLRADLKTRFESYQIAAAIGLLTVDEMRALEDLPPLPKSALPPPAPVPDPPAPDGQVPPAVNGVPQPSVNGSGG
jgi:HK97 family phage portal protein